VSLDTQGRLSAALADRYLLERELGQGGMATVYLARDLKHDRQVALKVLRPELAAVIGAERFLREIKTIATLQHPHIVALLDSGVVPGESGTEAVPYYVMPYLEGETLRERLTRTGALPLPEVLRFTSEITDALAKAHRAGIVHRDIKPENILLADGHAMVMDFGIAKGFSDAVGGQGLTTAGMSLGTPAYMAPEQVAADPGVDHRVDLYALGLVAYEMLAGGSPYAATTPQQQMAAHVTQPPAPLLTKRPDCPPALAALIMSCLAKEPAARPPDAGELLKQLGTVSVSPQTGATLSGTGRRWPILAAGALVLVAVGYGLTRGRSQSPVVAEGAELIAVMPLSAVSDSSLARLGKDLVVTLSANFEGVGSLHTVDAATLLMRARTLPSPLPLADAQALAKDLGATSVLTGTLISQGDQVRASVSLRLVGSDTTLATATAVAPPQEIAALTDSLSWAVLRQVWRRGVAPSPVLSGLTTASFDALRAFLDGERSFQRLDRDAAEASYRRAFELDSDFVQAYLRFDFVRSWSLKDEDPAAHARLLTLKERLPERERLWVETREFNLPLPERLEQWRGLLKRFPDYPPMLMSAADLIIHNGPIFGIPLAESSPLLQRLDRLVPDHADTRFHLAFVSRKLGTPSEALQRMAAAAQSANGTWRLLLDWDAELARSHATGEPLPPLEHAFPMARAIAHEAETDPLYGRFSGLLGVPGPENGYRLEVLAALRKAGIYEGELEVESAFGEGLMRIGRGDWTGGLAALSRLESSTLPMTMRLSAARLAVIGAWLGVVSPATADSILGRERQLPGAEGGIGDRVELRWLDGLMGVTLGDEPRMRAAAKLLTADTFDFAGFSARSLAGLWAARSNQTGATDSLRAVSDAAMRLGSLLSVEAVDRLVVGRALRGQGKPAEAEHYLMWTDAGVNTTRSLSVSISLAPLVEYDRGMALDEAGNRAEAARHLGRFLESFDRPSAAQRTMVEEARQRLTQLQLGDAPARPTPAP